MLDEVEYREDVTFKVDEISPKFIPSDGDTISFTYPDRVENQTEYDAILIMIGTEECPKVVINSFPVSSNTSISCEAPFKPTDS